MSASVVARTHLLSRLSHTVCVVTCCSRGFGIVYSMLLRRCFMPFVRTVTGASMLWLLLWQVFEGGCVTMWCPVFLQTEDKVGVSASWTCFRPYTHHMSYPYTFSSLLLTHYTWISMKGTDLVWLLEISWIICCCCRTPLFLGCLKCYGT